MAILLRRLIVTVTVLLVSLPLLGGNARAASGEELDAFVRERLEDAGVPGAAYAVVGPDGIEHSGVVGEDGDGRSVTTSTPFLWGSVAKPVAATLAVLLDRTGELGLDDPVVRHLPGLRVGSDAAAETITVRDLLDHTSGIGAWLDLTDRYDADRRAADVLAALGERELLAEPGTEFHYSSVNYLLLTAVIEEATGRTFADVLSERVLEPAAMGGAIADAEGAERLPPGHRYVLGRPVAFTTDLDPAGAGYGYLGGDLMDLAAFARQMLSTGTLLTPQERDAVLGAGSEPSPEGDYGLGWRRWTVPGGEAPMVWHAGAAPGYSAMVAILPEVDRAVVVLENAYGSFQEPRLLDAGWGVASLMSGDDPTVSGGDPLYPALLVALGLLSLTLLVLAIRWVRRLLRPVEVSWARLSVSSVAWLLALALVGVGLALLPRLFGVTFDQVVLWAPDVAWLVRVGLGLTLVGLLLRLALAVRLGARLVRRPSP